LIPQPPDSDDALISSINTTPLVDVMLVLLIIFLITIPVFSSSINVALPHESAQATDPNAEDVIVTVDANGALYWFDTPLPGASDLQELLVKVSAMKPQPELHIRADARADYAAIGQVVYAAQQSGIARIGFLTEPPEGPR
jgi:biopolymer transport protein ExbD